MEAALASLCTMPRPDCSVQLSGGAGAAAAPSLHDDSCLSLHWSDSWQLPGSNSWPLSATLCPAPDRLLSLSSLWVSTWHVVSPAQPSASLSGTRGSPSHSSFLSHIWLFPFIFLQSEGSDFSMLCSCINNSCPLAVIHHNPSGWALTPAHSHCLDHAETGHRHDVISHHTRDICLLRLGYWGHWQHYTSTHRPWD